MGDVPNWDTSSGFWLTAYGTHFRKTSKVYWNGVERETYTESPTKVRAWIPKTEIVTTGPRTVTVVTPAPGGGTSSPLTFTVDPLPPGTLAEHIRQLTPAWIAAGSAATQLTITGADLVSGSTVRFNNVGVPTTFISATEVRATLDATLLAKPTVATIAVVRPDGYTSNPLFFTVSGAAGLGIASVTSLSSTSGPGAGGATVTITGSNFEPDATVYFGGALAPTVTFVNSTTLSVVTPGHAAGTVDVVVSNRGGRSGVKTSAYTYSAPPPAISFISPGKATAGGGDFILIVYGRDFVNPSTDILWNGQLRTFSWVSSTQMKALIRATDITSAGTATVTARTFGLSPDSNPATFTLTTNPAIDRISPSAIAPGSPGFYLTVTGRGFVPGSLVYWNGSARSTSGSLTSLTAWIPATDVATAGTTTVTVVSPGTPPNGGTSNAVPFTICSGCVSIGTLSPASTYAGAPPPAVLNVFGSGFVAGSVVRWNGINRTTTFVSSTQLQYSLSPADLTSAGTATVTVLNPGGAVSNGASFGICPHGQASC